MNPLLSSPRNVAINQAYKLVREYVDGWYKVRDVAIPVYDLFVDHFVFDTPTGEWYAYIQPVGNPYTGYKIVFNPSSAMFVMTGTNIHTPIEIPESYVR